MNIIGLGSAGCNLAEMFEDDKTNLVKLFDANIEGENCFSLPVYKHPEFYENNFPDVKNFLSNLQDETIFFVSGAGKVSGASLKILKEVKDTKITCVYIRPDVELLGAINQMQDRLVFNVLQEYTRSGVFQEIILISNLCLEDILGEIPVVGYYQSLNNLLYNTYNNILKLKTVEPIISNYTAPSEVSRISTLGIYDIENDVEKLFYPLNTIDDKCYYFVINEKSLKSDGKLFKSLKDKMKQKTNNNIKISYKIFASQSEINYCYFTANTRVIQK